MLDTSPNSLPNMLADLLLYQPQEIKVFSIDMGLSTQRDISYGTWEKHIWDRFYPKSGHDPYSNYLFIEYLYNNNFISVDSKLKKILDLGIVDYMKELQEVYLDKALYKKTMNSIEWPNILDWPLSDSSVDIGANISPIVMIGIKKFTAVIMVKLFVNY